MMRNRTPKLLLAVLAASSVAGCMSAGSQQPAGAVVDDSVIASSVQSQLAQDPVTNVSRINVQTLSGIVRLSGSVDTNRERVRALQIARSVDGVKEVRDDLEIQGMVEEATH